MSPDVLRAGQGLEVLRSIVQRVAVDVVDHLTTSQRPAVRLLPHDQCARSPHVRLGHLDPRPHVLAPRPLADSHGTHRQHVGRTLPRSELGGSRTTDALRRRLEVARARRSTRVRAVVHRQSLGTLPVEGRATHGAGQVRQLPRRARVGRPIGLTAGGRAVEPPRLVAPEPVRLDVERLRAVVAGHCGHASQSSGSGTTAVVATGHGRDCLLIDLDERNADLARDRLGMFLDVVIPESEGAA